MLFACFRLSSKLVHAITRAQVILLKPESGRPFFWPRRRRNFPVVGGNFAANAAEVGGKLGEYQVRMNNLYFTIPWDFGYRISR